ncbi:MAG TPA: AAA family ATPase, partial [Verrucomicrobiae bacterium]|nr:AAA family ATPase [Verrucomicrobiae bacterium]
MIGRQQELAIAETAFAEAHRHRAPLVLRVTGGAGIGKTYFSRALLARLGATGWMTLEVACHPAQSHAVHIVSTRLAAAALEALGGEAARYASGLEDGLARFAPAVARAVGREYDAASLDEESYNLILRRLFEGIAADHDVAILCDDSQWIDAASAAALTALVRQTTMGSIALIAADRSDTAVEQPRLHSSIDINLRELGYDDSLVLAAQHLPGEHAGWPDMVVQRSGGNPLEIVLIAEELARSGSAEEVERSLRGRIAQSVAALEPAQREFVQICALIGDPIEYRLLSQLYRDPSVLERHLRQARGRFLTGAGPDFRFRHALVADAASETLAVTVPLHKRILDAYGDLDLELSDYDRIARHARACGDRQREFATYVELADRARRQQAWATAVHACERALSIKPPAAEQRSSFYVTYARALRAFDREPEAAEILLRAISAVDDAATESGIGELVATLVSIYLELEQVEQALQLYKRYASLLVDQRELASLVSAAMSVAASSIDDAFFASLDGGFSAVEASASAQARARRHAARATFFSATGEFAKVHSELAAANAHVDPANPRNLDLLAFASALYDFREHGCEVASTRLPDLNRRTRLGSENKFFSRLWEAWISFFCGEWERALSLVTDTYRPEMPLSRSAALLSIPAAIAALGDREPLYAKEIALTVRTAIHGGYRQSALQLAPWWLVRQRDTAAEAFVEKAVPTLAASPPRATAIGYLPASFAFLASARGDKAALACIAGQPDGRDRAAWPRANWDLARGLALSALGEASAKEALCGAARSLSALGAPLLAAYALERAGEAQASDVILLEKLGLLRDREAAARRKAPTATKSLLTTREWDVARQVASGSTNRQTAEALVLSERTVEAHLGNIFGKLGFSSR